MSVKLPWQKTEQSADAAQGSTKVAGLATAFATAREDQADRAGQGVPHGHADDVDPGRSEPDEHRDQPDRRPAERGRDA